MKYEIRAAYQGGQLTPEQRRSPLFAEEPRVLGTVLRRGIVLSLTEKQYAEAKPALERLEKNHVITVRAIGEGAEKLTEPGLKPGQELEVQRAKEEAARAEAKAKEEAAAVEERAKEAAQKATIAVQDEVRVSDQVTVTPVPTPAPEPVPEVPQQPLPTPEEITKQVEADTAAAPHPSTPGKKRRR